MQAMAEAAERQRDILNGYRELIREDQPLPLYHQVRLVLEQLIERGYLVKGQPFMSEEEIAERLGVSRPTVNKAMKSLMDDGYIHRQRGKRATVDTPHTVPLVFMAELLSFGEMLSKSGKEFHTELLTRAEVQPIERVAADLKLAPGEPVVYLRRLRFVEGEPILVVDSYLSAARYGQLLDLPEEAFQTNLFTLLANLFGVRVVRADREVRASHIPLEDAQVLDTAPWEACLRLQGIAFSEDGQPVEHFDSRLKGNRCVLRTSMSLPSATGETT